MDSENETHVHTTEPYSALKEKKKKKKEILTFTRKWTQLELIVLIKLTLTQKGYHCVFSLLGRT